MSSRFAAAVLAGSLLVLGCSAPAPTGTLHVENRGGPGLVFSVAGAPDVIVPCDGGASLTPGTSGMPALPWHLEVRRASDRGVVLTEDVAQLPRWFVQIGDQVVGTGLNPGPIEGPPGPPCGG